jgi:hypothetical protein
MRFVSGQRLKNISAALLLSGLIAGAICVLTSPVTANNATAVTISVNRASKGDRLPQTPRVEPTRKPGRHDTNSIENRAPKLTPRQTPIGCEPAFSPVAHPGRSDILTFCAA